MILFKAVDDNNTTSVANEKRGTEFSRVMSKCLMWLDRNFETEQEKKTARINDLCKRSYTGLFRQSVATLRVKNAASLEKWFQVLKEKDPNKSKNLSVKLIGNKV